MKKETGQKAWKWKMPKLRVGYRILLYVCMVLFAALALVNVAMECFPFEIGIVIYVLAACTLFSGVYYLFMDFRYGIKGRIKPAVLSNPFANKIASEYRLRTVVFTVPGLTSNILFAVFNAVVGIVSRSAWFGSLAAYYILLSTMRVDAVWQERKLSQIENEEIRREKEIRIYKKDSILFVFLAIVLMGMIVLMELSQGGAEYPGFTIYAAAAYAFYKIISSSVKVIKVKRQNSPLLTIIRRIGHIDACVSILTLQTAMFSAFGNGMDRTAMIMNAFTGALVCTVVLGNGILGICNAKKL